MEFNSLNHPQFSLWHTFSIIKARTSYILKGERSVVCENRNSEVSVLFIESVKKLNSLKHLVRTTVAGSHN